MSTSRRPRAKRTYHHENLRLALLAAARRMLEHAGPDALSLREVARRAGVSHNAPYRHFADRGALLAALASEGFDELAASMQRAAGAAKGRQLGAIGSAYVHFALAAPGLFRLMFGGVVRAAAHAEVAAAGQRAFAVLSGVAGPEAAGSDRAIAAWATVHGLAHLLLDGQIGSVRGDRAAAERLVGRILGAGA